MIPSRIYQFAYKLAHTARTYYWRLARPTVHGCAVITRNKLGEVLLVRPSYGKMIWQWPGGGVKPDEDVVSAASREVAEETGLRVDNLHLLGQASKLLYGATNVVSIYSASADGHPKPDEREILNAAWFPVDRLPDRRSIYVDEFLLRHRGVLEQG